MCPHGGTQLKQNYGSKWQNHHFCATMRSIDVVFVAWIVDETLNLFAEFGCFRFWGISYPITGQKKKNNPITSNRFLAKFLGAAMNLWAGHIQRIQGTRTIHTDDNRTEYWCFAFVLQHITLTSPSSATLKMSNRNSHHTLKQKIFSPDHHQKITMKKVIND